MNPRTTSAALLLTTCFLFAAPAAAQSGLSLIAGVTSATVSYEFEDGESADGIASRTGFAVGIGLNRGGDGPISFAPELLYVMKGANEEDGDFYTKL